MTVLALFAGDSIKKTGGTTFYSLLGTHFCRENLLPFLTESGELDHLLDETPRNKLKNTRIICGHLEYGVHNYFLGEYNYLTLIREPVERALSLYAYRRNYDQVGTKNFDPDHYRMCVKGWGNLQLRTILGKRSTDSGDLDSTDLNQAIKIIEDHFMLVGTTDKFDKFAFVLREIMGLTNCLYHHTRNNTERSKKAMLSDELIEFTEQKNLLDKKLKSICENKLRKKWIQYDSERFDKFKDTVQQYQAFVSSFTQVQQLESGLQLPIFSYLYRWLWKNRTGKKRYGFLEPGREQSELTGS